MPAQIWAPPAKNTPRAQECAEPPPKTGHPPRRTPPVARKCAEPPPKTGHPPEKNSLTQIASESPPEGSQGTVSTTDERGSQGWVEVEGVVDPIPVGTQLAFVIDGKLKRFTYRERQQHSELRQFLQFLNTRTQFVAGRVDFQGLPVVGQGFLKAPLLAVVVGPVGPGAGALDS